MGSITGMQNRTREEAPNQQFHPAITVSLGMLFNSPIACSYIGDACNSIRLLLITRYGNASYIIEQISIGVISLNLDFGALHRRNYPYISLIRDRIKELQILSTLL